MTVLSNVRVLVTGGAGFIGRHLYERLLSEGAIVHVFDNLSEQIHGAGAVFTDARVEFTQGDVCDLSAIGHAVARADVIYHLAAETGTGQSMYDIRRYVAVNDIGTATLLEAVANTRKADVQLILASSRSIYGEGAYRSVNGNLVQPDARGSEQLLNGTWEFYDELGGPLVPVATPVSLAPNPGSVYAATKYSQEMLLNVFCKSHGIPCSILRFQNVYGVGQSLLNPYTGIISIFYNRMRQGLPINIYEDGNESRDFVYVDDVVEALIRSVSVRGHKITANIGSGKQTKVLELAQKISQLSGIQVPINITGQFRLGDIRHCFADLGCAKGAFNYKPQVSLDDGLKRFIVWASGQPVSLDRSEVAFEELASKGLAKG